MGVGILGKEGQQAARSADYAIGQFKFLKPLMFVHGREAYRRNSLLILYTFYKNILYVTTQFFFGFWSSFSGQPLYEPMIYQLYNMTMTAAPIMFFALFDFEHQKDHDQFRREDPSRTNFYFMRDPHLYKIGLEYSCYGVSMFLKWVVYGLSHAFMIYIFNFHFLLLPGQNLADGKDIGFWVGGNYVYGVCVIVANFVIMIRFNNYTGWGEVLCFGSMLMYFTFYFLENLLTMFPQVYLIFDTTFMQPIMWIGISLTFMTVIVFELLIYRIGFLQIFGKSSNEDGEGSDNDGLIDDKHKKSES